MYYDGLLRLLIEYNDAVETQEFISAHDRLLENLRDEDRPSDSVEAVSASRTFRGQTRSGVVVRSFLDMFPLCPICGGRFYPNDATQVDHEVPHARRGETRVSNGRETHPFCNNQREYIEDIKAGKLLLVQPPFEDPKRLPKAEQLAFLFFTDDPQEDEIIESEEDLLDAEGAVEENEGEVADPNDS